MWIYRRCPCSPLQTPIPDQGQAGHIGRDRQGILSSWAGQGWSNLNGGISALLRIPEAAGAFSFSGAPTDPQELGFLLPQLSCTKEVSAP